MRWLFLLGMSLGLAWASMLAVGMPVDKLNDFQYETQFDDVVKVPADTKMVIISYEKGTSAMVNEILSAKPKDYLAQTKTVYISDIHEMPSIISSLFALPKMREYNYAIHLVNTEDFAKAFPQKPGALSVLQFTPEGTLDQIHYVDSTEALQPLMKQ